MPPAANAGDAAGTGHAADVRNPALGPARAMPHTAGTGDAADVRNLALRPACAMLHWGSASGRCGLMKI